jgi:hypothetical protein
MSGTEAGLHWLALVFTCATFVVAIAALMARSLFAMCMHLAAAGVLAAAAALALGAGDGALVLALFVAAWAPLLLLAAMLLTARATKAKRRGGPWFSLIAASGAAAVALFAVPDLGAAAPAAANPGPIGAWLASLLLAAAAACAGMLGYGERGALQQHPGPQP